MLLVYWKALKHGKIEKIDIKRESLMGGMSCGEVSLVFHGKS